MRGLALAGIGGAGGVLIAIFAVNGRWLAAAVAAIVALLWGAGSWKLWPAVNDGGLLGVVGASVVAAIATDGVAGPLLAVVLALAGWDLTRFLQRQVRVGFVEHVARVQRTHVQWLAITIAAGLGLAFAVQNLRISLGLGWVLLLGLLAALGLNWLMSLPTQRNQ